MKRGPAAGRPAALERRALDLVGRRGAAPEEALPVSAVHIYIYVEREREKDIYIYKYSYCYTVLYCIILSCIVLFYIIVYHKCMLGPP